MNDPAIESAAADWQASCAADDYVSASPSAPPWPPASFLACPPSA
ncbi:MAG: hypothetical protein ACXWNW_14315 [Isosphaeraceae bacterium]